MLVLSNDLVLSKSILIFNGTHFSIVPIFRKIFYKKTGFLTKIRHRKNNIQILAENDHFRACVVHIGKWIHLLGTFSKRILKDTDF